MSSWCPEIWMIHSSRMPSGSLLLDRMNLCKTANLLRNVGGYVYVWMKEVPLNVRRQYSPFLMRRKSGTVWLPPAGQNWAIQVDIPAEDEYSYSSGCNWTIRCGIPGHCESSSRSYLVCPLNMELTDNKQVIRQSKSLFWWLYTDYFSFKFPYYLWTE